MEYLKILLICLSFYFTACGQTNETNKVASEKQELKEEKQEVIKYKDNDLWLNVRTIPRNSQNYFESDTYIEAEDMKLQTISVKIENSKSVVLFFHGNGENVNHRGLQAKLKLIAEAGYSLLAVDYPGYGLSSGPRTLESMPQVAQLGYAEALKRFPGQEIIVWGQSLGTIPALKLAKDKEISALVCEGTISNMTMMLPAIQGLVEKRNPGAKVVLTGPRLFDNYVASEGVEVPAFFIHGEEDELARYDAAQKVFGRLKGPKKMHALADTGHNYGLEVVQGYLPELKKWLEEVGRE